MAAKLRAQRAAEAKIQSAQLAAMQGKVNRYKAMILEAISANWIVPDKVNKKLVCNFRIRLASNGTVLTVMLTKSSGDPVLDRSAEAAVYKASPLPVPKDPQVFNQFRVFNLTVRPEKVLSRVS